MLLLLELQKCRQADYGFSDMPFDMREEPHTKVIQFALGQMRAQ
jgi:hypothetical protein